MKIYLDSIGCRLNQSEIETMARQFRAAGHEIVPQADMAELAVVNTCAVTGQAASDSRAAIRRIGRAGVNQIVPTGCWSTLQPASAKTLPNVTHIVPNRNKERLVADLLNFSGSMDQNAPSAREPLPGMHRRTRAFIKVQDGCDNRCTFCITTVARGPSISRSVNDVIADINAAIAGGAKEVVLTGVHLGSWGRDFGSHLQSLIQTILRETDILRLRLSSLEPWDLDEDFLSLWADRRLMPHLHLPLQSGCRRTLKRMARNTTPEAFRKLVSSARSRLPDIAITTDIIAGFPGETDSEFSDTLDHLREMEFSGGHVFTYSPRPGTAASRMAGQVPIDVRKKRNHILREAIEDSESQYRRRFINRTMPVLWESATAAGENTWRVEGLTGNYLRVSANSTSSRWNEIDQVRIAGLSNKSLAGVIQYSG